MRMPASRTYRDVVVDGPTGVILADGNKKIFEKGQGVEGNAVPKTLVLDAPQMQIDTYAHYDAVLLVRNGMLNTRF